MSAVLLTEGLRHRRTRGMAHPLYPLVVQVPLSPSGDHRFAQALSNLLRQERDDIVVEATASTTRIYAADEAAATQAVESLRNTHGGALAVAGPDVRYHAGPPPLEPVMSVEVRMPVLFTSFVRRELQRRRGRIMETRPGRGTVLVLAEVPLAPLLGFARWMESLTDGRAAVRSALVRYAPLPPPSGPGPCAA